MTQMQRSPIIVRVDPANPGQFFACCGLLELADRLWGGAEGYFENGAFSLTVLSGQTNNVTSLGTLLGVIAAAPLEQVDPSDDYKSPIRIPTPFEMRLDWWQDNHAGGNRLKVWAGSMRSVRIARAMQQALARRELQHESLFDQGIVVYDPDEPDKKVEPFYFDGRRGANAHSIDIGFSPDSIKMISAAYPAVEFLCLVGLQRCRPLPTDTPRVFEYYTWAIPLEARLAPSAVCGLLTGIGSSGFRFENSFRTDQKKHKAFTPATPL